jgi:competence protein ComEC
MTPCFKSTTRRPITPLLRLSSVSLAFFARKHPVQPHCYTEHSTLREPLLAPLAAIAAGIVVSRFVPFGSRELLTGIAAFLILGVVSLRRKSPPLALTCALLSLMLAGTLTDVLHRPGPDPEIDTTSRTTLIVSGCVVQPPVFSDGREQFVLELDPGARARVNLTLREGEAPPVLRYGQKVEFDAKLRKTRNFGNPGAFDYARYLARQDIYWTASTRAGAPIHVLPGDCGSRWDAFLFHLRTAALEKLEQLYAGQPYETGMMEALLIGETSKLEKVWTDDFRHTGTFHALVISGTQVAALAAFFLFLLRLCFVPQMMALTLTAMASWLYALVTGWQAPVIRSAAGLTLFLVASYFYRQRRLLNLLAAVAIAFLVLDPQQLFEPSFQLSFLAVAFLGALAVPLIERTSGPLSRGLAHLSELQRDRRMPPRVAQFRVEIRLLAETIQVWTRWPERICQFLVTVPTRVALFVFELTITSAAVQVGLALPMAIYFHRVSLSGLTANAVIIPAFGLAVPVGFVAMFTGWIVPVRAAAALLTISKWTVRTHAQWEPNWRIPGPPLWLAIAMAASVIAMACAQRASRPWRIAATSIVFALLGLMLWHPFPPLIEPGMLEITTIDVGQGDSIFIAFPDGKLMLIDGGGIPAFGVRPSNPSVSAGAPRRVKSKLDIGEDVVSPYLWSRSIRRLDVIALSHAHEDHIGGLGAILENFHVKELWTGATPHSPSWDALRDKALRAGVKIVSMQRGSPFAYGGATLRILAPGPNYVPAADPRNNDSLTLRVSYGRRSALLTGDIERQVEAELLSENLVEHADILKVAHHGSKTSSTPAMLDSIHPAFAMISAGFENSYGHPHPDILARLSQRGVCVLRTDALGLVSIRTDGHRIVVATAHWSPGYALSPSTVAPD